MASSTVTVTSTTTTTKVSPTIHFDPSYVRTIPGILKIAQVVVSLIGFICSQTPFFSRYTSQAGWYSFVSMTAFWVTLVLFVFYLFHLIEKLHWIPWILSEFIYCTLWAVLYVIAGIVASTYAPYDGAWGAAAFFGFLGAFLYGFDAFLKFKGWRSGAIAQGERTVDSTTQATTSPSYPTY